MILETLIGLGIILIVSLIVYLVIKYKYFCYLILSLLVISFILIYANLIGEMILLSINGGP